MNNPLLIIPSYISKPEHLQVLGACVKSIRQSTSNDLLIVDDQSPSLNDAGDFYYQLQNQYENIKYEVNDVNSGFATTVNVGLRKALEEKRDAVLINADIEFREIGWLDVMGNTEGDIIGALLLFPNLAIQHAGIYFSVIARNFDHRFYGAPPNLPSAQKECDCPVTGALQYIKLNVLEDIGLYDEEFFLGHEDVDYCLRALYAGKRSVYNPKVKAIHHESLFRSESHKDEQRDSYLKLIEKHQHQNFFGVVPTMMEENMEETLSFDDTQNVTPDEDSQESSEQPQTDPFPDGDSSEVQETEPAEGRDAEYETADEYDADQEEDLNNINRPTSDEADQQEEVVEQQEAEDNGSE